MPSARTTLGPLTTTWTPPPICSYGVALCDTCTTIWQAQTCNTASDAHDFTGCWPSVSGSQSTVDPGVMMGWGLYSPGYICPQGYSTAAMVSSGGPTGSWGVEYSFLAGETAIACCPSGFSISYVSTLSTYGQTCVTTLHSATFSTVQCASGVLTNFAAATVPRTAANNQVLSSYILFAPLYQLNFQQSDLPPGGLPGQSTTSGGQTQSSSAGGSSPSPSSTLATKTTPGGGVIIQTVSGSTITQTPAQSQLPWGASAGGSANSSGGGGGLSQGAKIGIGVGVGAAALLGLVLLLFLLTRAVRRRRDGQAETIASSTEAGDLAAEEEKRKLGGGAVSGHRPRVSELDGTPYYAELPERGPSDRVPPTAEPGVQWRVSDQDWVVPPADGKAMHGMPGAGTDEAPSTPTRPHGNRVFELEGDSSGVPSSREGSVR